MVVPKDSSKMRRFQVSNNLLRYIGIGAAVCGVAVIFLAVQYLQFRQKVKDLEPIREEFNYQKVEFQGLVKGLDTLKKDLDNLRKFTRKFRQIAGLPQYENKMQQLTGLGGQADGGFLSFSRDQEKEFIKKLTTDMQKLRMELKHQQENLLEISEVVEDKKSLLACTPSIWPIRGWVTSGYGFRNSPFTGKREMHYGLDVATRFGVPIRASADGIVTFSAYKNNLGKAVIIEHGYGYSTVYGHNSEIFVQVGDKVKRHQVISSVGNTGRSTGPHLHYEVRLNGASVNPFSYIIN